MPFVSAWLNAVISSSYRSNALVMLLLALHAWTWITG
jgi:hypothetical protein